MGATSPLLSYTLKNSCSFAFSMIRSRYAGDASVEGCLRTDYGKFSEKKGEVIKFAARLEFSSHTQQAAGARDVLGSRATGSATSLKESTQSK